jgi:hypothetical protein
VNSPAGAAPWGADPLDADGVIGDWLGVGELGARPGCGVARPLGANGGGPSATGAPANALVKEPAVGAGDGVESTRGDANDGPSRCATHDGRS